MSQRGQSEDSVNDDHDIGQFDVDRQHRIVGQQRDDGVRVREPGSFDDKATTFRDTGVPVCDKFSQDGAEAAGAGAAQTSARDLDRSGDLSQAGDHRCYVIDKEVSPPRPSPQLSLQPRGLLCPEEPGDQGRRDGRGLVSVGNSGISAHRGLLPQRPRGSIA